MPDMPNFEVWRKPSAPNIDQPTVTLNANAINLNTAAVNVIGQPRKVELMYDRDARMVGIRPAVDPDSPSACSLRVLRGGKAAAATVSARTFYAHFNIAGYVRRRYVATVTDGILCVDLTAGHVPIGRTGRPIKQGA